MPGEMSRKQLVLIFRLLIIIVIACVVVFTPAGRASELRGYGFAAFYLLTNLVMAGLPRKYFEKPAIFYFFVFFDSLLILGGIYTTGLAETDLYLVYFMVLCLAIPYMRFGYLMINVLLFTGLYGWLLFSSGFLSGGMAASYILRLAFIPFIALSFGFIFTTMLGERKKRLEETQKRYRQLFESSDVFVYTVGLFGEFLSANPKFYEAYGFKDEVSMLGLSFSGFHEPGETEEFQAHVDKVFEQARPVQFESYDLRLDQWLSYTLSPIVDKARNRVFAVGVVAKDITERVRKEQELKKAYEKLRETRDQLIQKDKMAALGRLASGVAHEIRNPLEIISMGVDYLENIIPEENTSAGQSVEKIYSAIDRANAIINDVLKFSRKAEFIIEPVDIKALAEETISLASHNIEKAGVRVIRQYPEYGPKAAGNRNMLGQVLLNLVNNAVDSMKQAGTRELHVRVYVKNAEDVGYKTGYRRADYFRIGEAMAVVEIADTGRGISEDALPKIFEPFFTTKETGSGTGLGLSLAHMIVDRMMGTIDVSSRPDAGTTFYVKLQPEAKMQMLKEVEYGESSQKSAGY